MVQHELAKWLLRETDQIKMAEVLGFSKRWVVVPLDTKIALAASELARIHRLASADAIIYATALGLDADFLTCDAHFKGLDRVVYIPKAAG